MLLLYSVQQISTSGDTWYHGNMQFSLSLVVFALLWLAVVYAVNVAIARKLIRINWRTALLYFITVGMIGVFGEIFLDTVYKFFVGHPLWRYNILPIHDGYTSAYAPIIWGVYGFHIYLFHDTLRSKWSITRTRHLALILSIEALILESALTLSAIPLLGTLMYYYYPGDLWHVTSIQNMPFYFIFGAFASKAMRRFRTSPGFFVFLAVWFTVVIVFMT